MESSKGIRSKPRSRIADSIFSSVSNPSGSATRVSRDIFGLKLSRIESRQLAIPRLHSQENDRLKFRQDLLTLSQIGCPDALLFLQSLEAMLLDLGQADPTQGVTAHLECIAPLRF